MTPAKLVSLLPPSIRVGPYDIGIHVRTSEHQKDAGAALAGHRPTLVGLEGHQRPRPRVERLSAGCDPDVSLDHDQEEALLDLVLAELLTRFELDQNGTAFVSGAQNDWGAAAAGRLDLGKRPTPHRA
jgi:hypothetical protein